MNVRGLRLDPAVRALVEQVAAAAPPTLRDRGVDGARRYLEDNAANGRAGPEVAVVEDRVVDSAGVPVRVYRPHAADPLPVVAYFHGGGWVIGGLTVSDAFCRRLAVATPCVVVSVDYRLAPEHPWPAAVDDAVAACRWVASVATDIGGDPGRLVVLGDSAGGNVATVATRRLVADGGVVPARQILAYPTILTTQDGPSHDEHGGGWPLTSSDLAWFVELYVPGDVDPAHPDISPMHADVRGMPPTTIVLAGCDPLLDEGLAYAGHLAAAAVPVDLHLFAGQIHGFVTFPDDVMPQSREALGIVVNVVRGA